MTHGPGGYYSGTFQLGGGGWFSNATEMLKVLFALRNTSLLPAATIDDMLNEGIGAWVPYQGNWGTYYQKGGLAANGNQQGLSAQVVRFTQGYDLVFLANFNASVDYVNVLCGAFDSSGLPIGDGPPAISTVIGAATYLPAAAPGAYCSIVGSGFTDQPATDWSNSIIGSALPTSLGKVSVYVNGSAAYVQFVSASQVNFLLPANIATGDAVVELIVPNGVMSATLGIATVAPGLFCYTLSGVLHPAAVFATGSGTVYVAAVGALSGSASRPAAAGNIIELYATGCGPTSPVAPDGVVLTKAYPAANLAAFSITIAGKAAPILFAGLVGPGLWQMNVQIPSGLIGGDQPLSLVVSGVASQPNVMLTLAGG